MERISDFPRSFGRPSNKTISPIKLGRFFSRLWVRLGDTDLASTSDDFQTVEIRVASVAGHPKYSAREAYFDVAVFKLERRVQYNDYIVPVW